MLSTENILFKGVSKDDCCRMLTCLRAEEKRFRSGSRIASFSGDNDRIGIILSGTASMLRYDINGVRTIADTLTEQSIFGEFFTFTGSHRTSVELVADTDCIVLFIHREDILKRCENACVCHSTVVENLLMLMSEKTMSLSEHIEILSQRSIEEKVLSFLQITQDNSPAGSVPEIPFSMTAMADYLCVNRSALQREIARLKREGVIELNKRRFRILIQQE